MIRRIKNVVEGFKASRGIQNSPTGMVVILTKRCNSKCIMCNIWKEKDFRKELTLKDYDGLFSDPFLKGIDSITISGGEAMLSPILLEFFRLAVEKLPKLKHMAIATNAINYGLTSAKIHKIVDFLKDKSINLYVQISLDGFKDEHDAIRGVKGSYENATETMRLLARLRKKHPFLKYHINSVVQEVNLDRFDKFHEYISRKGISRIFSGVIESEGYYKNNNLVKRVDKKKIIQLLDNMSRREGRSNKFFIESLKRVYSGKDRVCGCMMGESILFIESDGKVCMCMNTENIPFGNIRKESLRDIWFSEENKIKRQKIREQYCRKCVANCSVNDYLFIKDMLTKPLRYLGVR